ncbi:MAG: hypothetical protein QNJ64_11395 [Crocosphaera sp.]|nr:hypothetical protein [Crocosphaera sp.]
MSNLKKSPIKFYLYLYFSSLRQIGRSLILPIISQVFFFLIVLLAAKIQIFFIFLFIFIQISTYLFLSLSAFLGKLNWGTVVTICYVPFPLVFPLFLVFPLLLPLGLIYILLNPIIKNQDKHFELSKYPKLSIVRIFANKLEPKKLYSTYLLLITTAGYSILGLLWDKLDINIYFILGVLIYASLLYLNTFLVNFRIKKGFYGGNEFEAREIINFIEENSETIDFSDGNTPKKLFNEEDLKEIEEEIMLELNGFPQPNI